MKEKKEISLEEKYKKNQKTAKILKNLAPICFWGFLTLSIICLIFALKNSFGNMAEIMTLLDSKSFNGEQLQENYNMLIDKYGEWVIGNGSNGFTIKFINIGKAVFSGLMITNCVLFVIFLASAYILGKWVLPKLSSQILTENQDMVNLTILKDKNKEEK